MMSVFDSLFSKTTRNLRHNLNQVEASAGYISRHAYKTSSLYAKEKDNSKLQRLVSFVLKIEPNGPKSFDERNSETDPGQPFQYRGDCTAACYYPIRPTNRGE